MQKEPTQLDLFVSDSIKTESTIPHVVVNKDFIEQTISILINAGNILDQIKKQTFYSKPHNLIGLQKHLTGITESINTLNAINCNTLISNKSTLKVNPRVFHSIVGITTEATELLEALDLDTKKIDTVNIAEELGDIAWYCAIGMDELDLSYDDVLALVIKKLKTRFPNKFTNDSAINRDLGRERAVLNKIQP